MTTMENVSVLLVKEPADRRVEVSDMEVVQAPFSIPEDLEPGTLVVRNLYLSLDPYLRMRMNVSQKSYFPPFELGKVITSGAVAEVIAGSRDRIQVGDLVAASSGWEKYSILPPASQVHKLDKNSPFSPSLSLGILGMPGATAYYGLSLCDPQPGQTIFVSGAAGAVGLAVGQMAKAKGLTVIGSAGSEEKVKALKEQYGFDEAFNYKDYQGKIQEKLQELSPDGIDCYFDNVGAEHLDAALGCLKSHGKISACGMISTYNGETYGYRNITFIVGKRIKIEGFIIGDKLADPEFMGTFRADVSTWLAEDKLSAPECIVEGVEKAPEAFVGLFTGVNMGKLIVKV